MDDLEGTIELFAELIGRVVINHEDINRILRAYTTIMRCNLTEWNYGVFDENDPVEAFKNTLTDSELREYFKFIFLKWHDTQFRLLGKPEFYENYPETLMKCINKENKIRNEIIHSHMTFMLGVAKARRGQSSRGKNRGKLAKKTIKRKDYLGFIGYQIKLRRHIEDFCEQLGVEIIDGDEIFNSAFFRDPNYILKNSDKFDVNTDADIIEYAEKDDLKQFGKEQENWKWEKGEEGLALGLVHPQKELIEKFKAKVDGITKINSIRKNLSINKAIIEYSDSLDFIHSSPYNED